MKNIYQRINEVMKEVVYVQKDKQISGGGPAYKAVTHDQVISVARESLVKNGIMIFPVQIKSNLIIKRDVKADVKMHLYSGDYIINFVNIDDPKDRIKVRVNAHAADNGDKAPGKGLTYATKMALLKVLCLETGENDESRAEQRDVTYITEEQKQELSGYINGNQALWVKVCKAAKINSLDDLKASKFNQFKKMVSRNANS